MRRARAAIAAIGVLLALGSAGSASAQPAPHQDRFRINVDAGAQLSSIAFDTTTTQPVYLENAVISTSYTVRRGLLADGGVSVAVAGPFAIGVTVSSLMGKNDAAVSAAVPHPFFFKTPRTVTGTAPALRRDELAAHLQALYIVQPNARIDVALSAGPSFFQLRQDVVTGISFTDTYPYDTAAFTAAVTQRASANAVGFNVGADVSVRLSRHAGIGVVARFARAKADLAVPNGGGTVSVDAGGAQIAGGLRLFF